MLTAFELLPSRPQAQIPDLPYDTWINPEGSVSAQFYRTLEGYLVRFPKQADFHISRHSLEVCCSPSPDVPLSSVQTLFQNSIEPIIGNHRGELHLHGSAVAIGNAAIAFLGVSRRGKTTLAGAFARSGYPFLSEDVIKLTPLDEGYRLNPHKGPLRLFSDSAAYLLGEGLGEDQGEDKLAVIANGQLASCDHPLPLHMLFILGPGLVDSVKIRPVSQSGAISQLLQQSFILDVEDTKMLRGHFERIGNIARLIPCFELDYPRSFEQLDNVIINVVQLISKGETPADTAAY